MGPLLLSCILLLGSIKTMFSLSLPQPSFLHPSTLIMVLPLLSFCFSNTPVIFVDAVPDLPADNFSEGRGLVERNVRSAIERKTNVITNVGSRGRGSSLGGNVDSGVRGFVRT